MVWISGLMLSTRHHFESIGSIDKTGNKLRSVLNGVKFRAFVLGRNPATKRVIGAELIMLIYLEANLRAALCFLSPTRKTKHTSPVASKNRLEVSGTGGGEGGGEGLLPPLLLGIKGMIAPPAGRRGSNMAFENPGPKAVGGA